VLGALACVAALALPAAADTESEELENAVAVFSAKATHGYSMLVLAGLDSDEPPTRGGPSRGSAIVYLFRGDDAAVYLAPPATVTADFIEGIPTVTSMHVGLGKLGEMTLDFKPSGGKRAARHPHCRVGSFPYAAGSYEGTIEFHGEQNFADVSTSKVVERPEAFLNLLCSTERTNEVSGPRLPGARLEVQSRRPGEPVLQVNKNRVAAPVHITAAVEEDHPRLIVFRSVIVNAPSRAFGFDRRLRHARVSPGAPFAGQAVFERDARPRNRWRGNLTVDFPGKANVRLARPGRHVVLEHAVRRVTGHGPSGERAARLLRAIVR
jgi:hypothetical protein